MDFDLDQGVAILERTPRVLHAMLDALPPAWTDATEGPDTWSPFVIVGHLIHGERADWIPRATLILDQGATRRFTPFDRLAQFRESTGKVARRVTRRICAAPRAQRGNTYRVATHAPHSSRSRESTRSLVR